MERKFLEDVEFPEAPKTTVTKLRAARVKLNKAIKKGHSGLTIPPVVLRVVGTAVVLVFLTLLMRGGCTGACSFMSGHKWHSPEDMNRDYKAWKAEGN